ncbi:MAG: hypothetical protein AB1324_00700 [Candidatus Micrarchaeota archaeon]
MDYRLDLNGMTCGSCERLIQRVAEQNGGTVREVDANSGVVTLACDETALGKIKSELASKGFPERRAGEGQRGDPARVGKYVASIIAGEAHVETEGRLLNYALGSAASLVLLFGAVYAAFQAIIPSAFAYLPLIALAIASSVLSVFSYSHMKAYSRSISCSNGMMVGMTMGMISGFLVGALVGAANGMFIGSLAGMAAGIALGGNLGRCCGIMGALEGVMAGLMAGIMGAMTSVMMLGDNLVLFLYILFGVCAFVLGGLSYMMFREAGAAPADAQKARFAEFAGASAAFAIALSLVMVYGPKGPFVYP